MNSVNERGPLAGFVSTGTDQIDKTLGGGIPYGTLMLIEGESGSGKSTLAQQLVWGALQSGEKAALYTTEQTVQTVLRQLDSLSLDVRDYFLLNELQIYPVSIAPGTIEPMVIFQGLAKHIEEQDECRVVVVDSLTTFVSHAGGDQIQGFFARCKAICDTGKVVICTVHSDAFDQNILTRVRSVCDAYLRLQVTKSGNQLLKTIEVAKM